MGKNILNKFLNVIGYEEEEEEYYEEDMTDEELDEEDNSSSGVEVEPIRYASSRKSNKVVSMHSHAQLKLVVKKPQSYHEATVICDYLKNKRPVVVNLEDLQREVAQRIIDFLSGATYSLEGNIHTVTNSIFIIAPKNVDVTGEDEDEHEENDENETFQWMK